MSGRNAESIKLDAGHRSLPSSTDVPSRLTRKLLFATASPAEGGAEKYLRTLIHGAKRRGYEIMVAFVRRPGIGSFKKEISRAGIQTRWLEVSNSGSWSECGVLRTAIRAYKPDLVHINAHHLLHRYVRWLALLRVRGLPCVATCHMTDTGFELPMRSRVTLRWSTRRSFSAIAVTDQARSDLLREYGIDQRNVVLIRHGMDMADCSISRASRAELRRVLNLAEDTVAVIYVGRLSAEKGVDLLLRAAVKVVKSHPRVVFLIAGDGPQLSDLRALAQRLGIASIVRFLGWRSDIPALLRAADAFVLPSVKEEFGYSLLEAGDARLPSVSTQTPGPMEILGREQPEQLVPPGDYCALADAIAMLVASPDRRRRLGEEAHRYVATNFSKTRMLEQTFALFESAVAARPTCKSVLTEKTIPLR